MRLLNLSAHLQFRHSVLSAIQFLINKSFYIPKTIKRISIKINTIFKLREKVFQFNIAC